MITKLIQQDLNHIWHPCSYMKDFEQDPPLVIKRARGSYLYTDQGPIIDAISSWWCKSLGHSHPAVMNSIKKQLSKFEHVISANTTNKNIVELAKELCAISNLQHVYFASDGSSAVEIAMKLAIHGSQLKGYPSRTQFIALSRGYHGETLGTLSISDLGIYKKPYSSFNLPCYFLDNIPYVTSEEDPLWHSCDTIWPSILKQLNELKDTTCAIVLEPIIQGAGGMLCYSADFLHKISIWAKQHDIYLIADEIMTGLGRTGKWLALQHAGVNADMICLSKGLTSGSLPLSCVLVDHPIYELFYHEPSADKSFLHSHTYSGNPLATSAALATIKTMQSESIIDGVKELGDCMRRNFENLISQTGKLTNMRSIGAVVAADLIGPSEARIGYQIAQEAQKRGALLRPLGSTLYWLPPLTTDQKTIDKLADITFNSIEAVYKRI